MLVVLPDTRPISSVYQYSFNPIRGTLGITAPNSIGVNLVTLSKGQGKDWARFERGFPALLFLAR